MKIVLASASPRREELLKTIVENFEIRPYTGGEDIPLTSPAKYVRQLARTKAEGVFDADTDDVTIGADTVVVFRGQILGKPTDTTDAVRMLKMLSGRTHTVFTGVCIRKNDSYKVFSVKSRVTFHQLDESRILDYVATGSPMDKAGAYGIQDSGFVKKIRGSFTNVMGLPMEKLEKILRKEEVYG